MTLTVEFSIDFRGQKYQSIEKGLRAYADHMNVNVANAGPALSKEMKDFLDSVALALSRRHSAKWGGGMVNPSDKLQVRSGGLMESIKESVHVDGTKIDDITGTIGGPFWLTVHELGATITPRRSKYLTVPMPDALNANGTPIRMKARDWDNTFVIKTKDGKLFIVQRQGRKLLYLYALKTRVVIRPRLRMMDTIKAGLPYFTQKAADSMLKAIING